MKKNLGAIPKSKAATPATKDGMSTMTPVPTVTAAAGKSPKNSPRNQEEDMLLDLQDDSVALMVDTDEEDTFLKSSQSAE